MRKTEFTFESIYETLEAYHSVLEQADQLLDDYIETQSYSSQYSLMKNWRPDLVSVSYDTEFVYFEGEVMCRGGLDSYSVEMPLAFVYSSEYRARLVRENTLQLELQVVKQTQATNAAHAREADKRRAMYEELKKEFE